MINELYVGGAFVVAGIGGVAMMVRDLNRAFDSPDWPTVEGEIVETGVMTSLADRGGFMYAPLVRYRYKVGDQQFVNDKISFGVFSSNLRFLAEEEAERYRTGKLVKVHYSPKEPMVCVLDPGAKWAEYVAFFISILFFGLGIRILGAALGWTLPDWLHVG